MLDETLDREAPMTEMFKNANQEYLQKSYSEGSPTDFADVRGISMFSPFHLLDLYESPNRYFQLNPSLNPILIMAKR